MDHFLLRLLWLIQFYLESSSRSFRDLLLQVNRYFFTFVELVQIPSVGINLKSKHWFLICLGASRIAQIWMNKSPKIRLRTSAAYIILDQFWTWNSWWLRLVATIDIRVESLGPSMSLPININHQIYQAFHRLRFLNQIYWYILFKPKKVVLVNLRISLTINSTFTSNCLVKT